jgi:hypothetical protein
MLTSFVIAGDLKSMEMCDIEHILNCSNEIQHVSSGLHQLEQQQQAAHYNLLAEGQHCVKLHSRVYSAQEELLKQLQCLAKLLADFKNAVICFYSFIVIYCVRFLHTMNVIIGIKEHFGKLLVAE